MLKHAPDFCLGSLIDTKAVGFADKHSPFLDDPVLEDPGLEAAVLKVDIGGVDLPVVVRLARTNLAEGRAIMQRSGIAYVQADNLDDAAAKAVAALQEVPA